MTEFLPGDIIVVNFPFEDKPTLFKVRPVMVVSKYDQDHYRVAKITKTNLVGKVKGEWIDENSIEYKSMNLDFPSFIKLENLICISNTLIKKGPIGKYPSVDRLFEIHGIK
jgi:hypothetical protein